MTSLRERVYRVVSEAGLSWFAPEFTGRGWKWEWRRDVRWPTVTPYEEAIAREDVRWDARWELAPDGTAIYIRPVRFDLVVSDGTLRRDLAMVSRHPGRDAVFTHTVSMRDDEGITDEWLLRAWRYVSTPEDIWDGE